MSSKVTIKLNTGEVRKLLRSSEAKDICRMYAGQVRGSAGDGYAVEDRTYQERAGAAVVTETPEAYYSNIKHNTLIKALSGTRGK